MMSDGRLTEEELERRLEELRARVTRAAPRKELPTHLDPYGLSWIAAAVVFIALLIYRDFVHHPEGASLMALVGAAASFLVVRLILWMIRRARIR